MRRALILVLASGCRQILGFDSASTTTDGPVVIDAPPTRDASAPVDETLPATMSISFQQGAGGYAGARDTYIEGGSPNVSNATNSQLRWRATDRDTLIAFDEIFGTGVIPLGATIVSATLEIQINSAGASGMIYEIVPQWPDTVTFNSFGPAPGVDSADLGTVVGAIPTAPGITMIDVTASLAAWSSDPTKNQGWIFHAEGSAGGDSIARSSEDGVIGARPRLSVMYHP